MIDDLVEENRVLKEQLGKKRLRLNDDQRHSVARSTIARTLKDNGIPPSANRAASWKTFLKAHADVIAAADFFNVEVWTTRGLVTHHALFVIHHATRAVCIAGITTSPDSAFMAQVARNLTDHVDGFLRNKRSLIVDNDVLFTSQFERILADAGVKLARTAIQAPDRNAIAERWVRSIKTECLNKIIPFGFRTLERSINELVAHCNLERPHQGIGNKLIAGCGPKRAFRTAVTRSRPQPAEEPVQYA